MVDLGKKDFKEKLRNFARSPDHGDVVGLVVMSHGEPWNEAEWSYGEKIIASDGKMIDIERDILG